MALGPCAVPIDRGSVRFRNVRRDPRVSVTILSPERGEVMRPYLAVTGTARIVEGGTPELRTELAKTLASPGVKFPPDNAPPGLLTRIRIDKVGGIGPWAS